MYIINQMEAAIYFYILDIKYQKKIIKLKYMYLMLAFPSLLEGKGVL